MRCPKIILVELLDTRWRSFRIMRRLDNGQSSEKLEVYYVRTNTFAKRLNP